MNYKEEWDRISKLSIEQVEFELRTLEVEKSKLKPGAYTSLNAKIVMLQLRKEKY